MASKNELVKQVKALLWERGQKALEIAKHAVLHEKVELKSFGVALNYFVEEFWTDVFHPAMLALACEAVGGDPDVTTHVGAAVVLLASGADVHDDIIDQSESKDSKPTLFGKYGKDTAIVVGDFLFLKGIHMLCEAAERFPKKQKQSVIELITHAFFEIGNAEIKESCEPVRLMKYYRTLFMAFQNEI